MVVCRVGTAVRKGEIMVAVSSNEILASFINAGLVDRFDENGNPHFVGHGPIKELYQLLDGFGEVKVDLSDYGLSQRGRWFDLESDEILIGEHLQSGLDPDLIKFDTSVSLRCRVLLMVMCYGCRNVVLFV